MADVIQDSTYSDLLWIPESTLGTTPATGAAYRLNATNAPIRLERNRERPNVWSRSRRPHPSRIVSKKGSVEVTAPLQYLNMAPLHEAFFGAATGTPVEVTGTGIAFVEDTTDTITDTGNGLAVFLLGYMVHVSGAGEDDNNGWKGPVLATAAGTLTIPDGQIVDESAGESITLHCTPLLDGETETSGTMQWHATKLDYRRNMAGTKVDVWGLNWQGEQYINERFAMMGRAPTKASAIIGNSIASGYPQASDFFTSADDLKKIYIGNSALGNVELCLSELSFAAQNNREAIMQLNLGQPKDYIFGQLFAEWAAQAYADGTAESIADAIDADDTFYAYATMEDPDGNGVAIFTPACKGIGDLLPGERNTKVRFADVRFDAHDPAKDASSDFYNSGTGPGFMVGAFFRPAP